MKKLYSYQKRVHTLVLKTLCDIGIALMVMAPGLGKTVVSAFLLKAIHKGKKKTLFLCHDNYILDQANEEFRETFDPEYKLTFHNFFGSLKDIEEAKKTDVVFASFQSLNNGKSKWYEYFSKKHFAYIIVDEGHHAQAPTFKEVVEYFKPEKLLAMTGTPDRTDDSDIREMFGDEVVNITIEEGIAKGWLTDVEYHILSDGLDKNALKQLFQDVVEEKQKISLNQINKRLFVKKRDEQQVKLIKKHTKNWTKKCIIFCASIHHIRSFAKNIEKGTYCTFHSENSIKTNNKHLDAFKNGNVNVILTVNKFNEGIDVPSAEVIVFLRVTESGIVFRQQLGRGLRKMIGKNKVIVLDFVANVRRILMIQGMLKKIEYFPGAVRADKSLLSVTGKHYTFDFTDDLEDVLEILKVARIGFYETWREASMAALVLGIRTMREYQKRYKEDRQLPSMPEKIYSDFPGYHIFLSKKIVSPYKTWQESSIAAVLLGIKSQKEYFLSYKKDPKLPGSPLYHYKNFPGFTKFLGKIVHPRLVPYKTWQEASLSVKRLKINSYHEYREKRKKDLRLPSDPRKYYKNFPGANKFFEKMVTERYKTWQEASRATKSLGIRSQKEYQLFYKKDSKLPSNPATFYKNFPGFTKFLGKKDRGNPYVTWRKAGNAAIKLKIKSSNDYKLKYKKDNQLPSNPDQIYSDFPGWDKFLGKK